MLKIVSTMATKNNNIISRLILANLLVHALHNIPYSVVTFKKLKTYYAAVSFQQHKHITRTSTLVKAGIFMLVPLVFYF